MNLHDGYVGSVQIVSFRFAGVENLDGECSSGNGEDGSSEKVLGELDSVQGGTENGYIRLGSLNDNKTTLLICYGNHQLLILIGEKHELSLRRMKWKLQTLI